MLQLYATMLEGPTLGIDHSHQTTQDDRNPASMSAMRLSSPISSPPVPTYEPWETFSLSASPSYLSTALPKERPSHSRPPRVTSDCWDEQYTSTASLNSTVRPHASPSAQQFTWRDGQLETTTETMLTVSDPRLPAWLGGATDSSNQLSRLRHTQPMDDVARQAKRANRRCFQCGRAHTTQWRKGPCGLMYSCESFLFAPVMY